MDARNNIATDLFYKVRSRFSGLQLGSETGEITINPEEARFFDFDYKEGENPIGHVSISLAEPNSMKVYFSHGITEAMDQGQKDNWYGFLKELRMFAKRRLLNFDTRDIAKDNLDQRDYEFLSQYANPNKQRNDSMSRPVGESIMSESSLYGSKTMSYQKLMDTRLIIKHSRALEDDMVPGARSRNISGLFVENADGERFKYPFIHLAGARAMQRHVANGGKPYDAIGESIIKMSEEIAQLRSFSNYVARNDLMNSQTNSIVERGTAQLNSLREQIKALAKQSHYEAYRENFKAMEPLEVPQDVVEDFTDKFTVRNFKEDIATVFPVLYRLMKENNTVGYDDIVAMTQQDTINNEDLDVITTEDPFSRFESWVMGLGEESAIQSTDPEEQQAALQQLQALVGEHFPAGVDGSNAIESLKGIIEDPQLDQAIKELAQQDPEACTRGLVKAWLEQNAPETLEELDFGDYQDDANMDNIPDYQQAGESIEEDDALKKKQTPWKQGRRYQYQPGPGPKDFGGPEDDKTWSKSNPEYVSWKESPQGKSYFAQLDAYHKQQTNLRRQQMFPGIYPEEDPIENPDPKKFGMPPKYIDPEDNEPSDEYFSKSYRAWAATPKKTEYDSAREKHSKEQEKARLSHGKTKGFDTEMVIRNPYFENPDIEYDEDDEEPEEIDVGVNYEISGGYYPATWDSPAEYPDVDIYQVVDLETGEDITDLVDLDKIAQDIYEQHTNSEPDYDEGIDMTEGPDKKDIPAAHRKASGDKDWKVTQKDLDKEKDSRISHKDTLAKNSGKMNVQEIAEFVHSFYDRDSGTFPKGPEGVAVMVGKKFGEQAEQVARKFVERMAPNQTTKHNPELQELMRVKELAGIR
jgi:hypothetical protein